MRSIRNAAVAGVTALAVSLSGVTAFAAETPKGETTAASENTTPTAGDKDKKAKESKGSSEGTDNKGDKAESKGNLSSKLSPEYEGEKAVRGQDAFGSHKLDSKDLPKWFNAWEGFTIAGIVLTILTNLIAPAYNYLKFNGII
ncbi:hypothetical protein [Corynebacterium glucuronolyticum]|uniref:hypothetical protein n=1 Tax=Corynebacterium glucuronolyticum TaxID=39791 RepID=UPI00223A8EDF|nr:hypothetical protein [Corynebacterium glucuronolyticum]MCT1563038.1 hypothetical protein [Corynebacterium glucuronolyticum]